MIKEKKITERKSSGNHEDWKKMTGLAIPAYGNPRDRIMNWEYSGSDPKIIEWTKWKYILGLSGRAFDGYCESFSGEGEAASSFRTLEMNIGQKSKGGVGKQNW